jgi:CMP-N,N'-diacetyllegionaminic acid synthase
MPSVAVIPARGGSKSIPNKNLVQIHGKPLIAWTIEQAKRSGVCDYIHVSTDSAKIAEAAIEHGAACTFLRPADLAGDSIGTGQAIYHSLTVLSANGFDFDHVLELQPTYCFRGSQLIRDCLQALQSADAASVITCKKIQDTSHPDFVLKADAHGFVEFSASKPDQFARQFIDDRYCCHGVVLGAKSDKFLTQRSFFGDACLLHEVIDPIRLTDINEPSDLEYAKHLATQHADKML